jgi:RNA polymerase sigma factor (sigma-70 family)
MQPTDDGALLRQYADNHSDAAFAGLVTRHINLVYSVALRHVGNPHQAEEITQAVFIILARKARSLRHDQALSSWLFQATRLTAHNFVRSEVRRHRREQEAYMQSVLKAAGENIWERIGPLLDAAVGALNDEDRRAIVLRFYEGRNLREVGAALQTSEEAAKKRVARALEKLQLFFAQRGVNSTTSAIAETISAHSVQAAPVALAKIVTAAALAKGTVASTSTLTLIKGALKIMAWTKTKTAIVAGAAAILGIGTTTVVVEALLPIPDIRGTWEGTFIIPKADYGVHKGESPKTRYVLRITETNGGYQASVEDIDRGVEDGMFDTFTYKYPYVHAATHPSRHGQDTWPDVSCVGKVSRFGGKMFWKSLEGTNAYTMEFRPTAHPAPFPEPLTDEEFAPRAGSDLQGFWTGMIGPGKGGLRLHIQVKIAEPSDGTFRADLYSPDQSTNRLPTAVSYDGTTVKLMPMAGYGMFQGALRNGGKEMAGHWIQGGRQAPTTFTRAN